MHRVTGCGRRARAAAAVVCLGLLVGSVSARTASAANAIGFAAWDGGAIEVHLDSMGDAARASGQAGLASSMAGNPSLLGSAWAHTGKWWSLQLGALDGVRIRVEAASPADFSPGLAIWAIGNAGPFDGGTTSFGAEIAASGFGTPHTFNATGALGDAGTLWMQQGQGGNAKELLGYAVSGPSVVGATGWDESIEHGAHDRRLTDDYVASVSGNAGAGFAELQLGGVQSGWYLIYVGGTDHARAGGLYDLHVVPEASTAALLALGLGVVARARRSTRSY